MKHTIAELRALEKAATPGPWEVFKIESPVGVSERIFHDLDHGIPLGAIDIAHIPMPWPKNGEFIATARNVLPDLLDRIEAQEKLLAEAHELLKPVNDHGLSLEWLNRRRAFLDKLEKESKDG